MNDHDPFSSASEEARWEALARTLAGESGADEKAALDRHLAAHPQHQALYRALEAGVAGHPPASPPVDVDAALRSVRARREADELSPRRAAAPAPPRTLVPAWAAAAAVVLLLAAGLLWRAGVLTPAREIGYASAVGARRSLRLADGTEVVLGPASELRVAAGYAGGERQVRLSGEALFTVRHDAAHPFTVATRDALIRDVGTRFSVRSGVSSGSRVMVAEGAVRLAPVNGAPALLRAGDRAQVAGAAIKLQRGRAAEEDTAWVRGRLVFRDAPLAEVVDALRRWYGVELRVSDPALASRHITADFAGEKADEVVRIIAATLGGEAHRQSEAVFVVSSGGESGMR